MTLAAVLFAIAAVLGITIATIRIRGAALPPMPLALLHGLFAASGLVALALVVFGGTAPLYAKVALGGFVVGALGGFTLFSFHLRKRALPVPLIAIHGLVGVLSFISLLAAIFLRQ